MADTIRYDLLVQDALRGVVRKVLSDVARDGLPGEHHFFIAFKTHAPGVQLSERMRKEYPGEMTIILQHQFWGLKVLDQGFEAGLSFHKVPETLFIPFEAITGFFDPSAPFNLKFDVEVGANDVDGPAIPDAEGGALVTASGDGTPLAHSPDATSATEPAAEGDAKVVSIDAFRKKP